MVYWSYACVEDGLIMVSPAVGYAAAAISPLKNQVRANSDPLGAVENAVFIAEARVFQRTAMGYLALRDDGPMRVHELAEAIGAPIVYLSKIIHLLAKKGFFDTLRGTGGGVVLGSGVDPRRVTLLDLCEAMDEL